MKNKFFLISSITVGALFAFFVIVYSYLFHPAIFAAFCNIFFPDERYSVQVVINGKKHDLPVYIKKMAGENRQGEIVPALILCNIPLPSGIEHLKIFPNGIGVFQYPPQWFVIKERYVLIKECSFVTIDLRDDMKGWGTDYTIEEKGDFLIYHILQSKKADSIVVIIPKSILKSIPPNDLFYLPN